MPAKKGERRNVIRVAYKDLLIIQKPYSFKITVFDSEGRILCEQPAEYLYSGTELQQIAKEIREWHRE